MLETIRQFAEEQLVASGEATWRVPRMPATSRAGSRHLALWDSPRQPEAYAWFTVELANLRTAFRWAADHGDLDIAAAIATYAGLIGYWSKIRAHQLGRRAHRARPRRRPSAAGALYVWRAMLDRRTHRRGPPIRRSRPGGHCERPRRGAVRVRGLAWRRFHPIGQPDRSVEWCGAELASNRDAHVFTRAR